MVRIYELAGNGKDGIFGAPCEACLSSNKVFVLLQLELGLVPQLTWELLSPSRHCLLIDVCL